MSGPSPIERARAAWGEDMPAWVMDLAAECERTSQNKVAAQMRRSATLVSQVLGRKYPGSYAAVEEVVSGVFKGLTVACPALGEIPANECRDWRLKAVRFVNVNAARVRMYRACSACPRNMKSEATG